jgi:cytochrome P450
LAADGVWQEQRAFMLQSLNELCMSDKKAMEKFVSTEAEELIQDISKQANHGKEVNLSNLFLLSTCRVICTLVSGRKATRKEISTILDIVNSYFNHLSSKNILSLLQIGSTWFCGFIFKYFKGLSFLAVIANYKKEVNKLFIRNTERNGFYVDRFLTEMKKSSGSGSQTFTNIDGPKNLVNSLTDMINAGTETSAVMMEWMILFLCQYPLVQDRIHNEIVNTLKSTGNEKLSLKDMKAMPYFEAVIEEVIRI